MIIVSSDQAIKDLFDKRSAIYSSRPEMYLAGTVASHGLRMALMVCYLSYLTPPDKYSPSLPSN